jgi:hypothetical protein
MKNTIKTAAILTTLLLAGCATTATKEINREGVVLQITTHVYSGVGDLTKTTHEKSKGLNGEAVYSLHDNVCDISVKTGGIIEVDGSFAKTLGHELMHCLYGAYHD